IVPAVVRSSRQAETCFSAPGTRGAGAQPRPFPEGVAWTCPEGCAGVCAWAGEARVAATTPAVRTLRTSIPAPRGGDVGAPVIVRRGRGRGHVGGPHIADVRHVAWSWAWGGVGYRR